VQRHLAFDTDFVDKSAIAGSTFAHDDLLPIDQDVAMVDGDGIVGNDERIMLVTANGGPFNDQLVGTAFEVFVSKVQLRQTTAGSASDVSHEADDAPRSTKMSPLFCGGGLTIYH